MTQLIINGIYLPETSRNKYSCATTLLGENVLMISGRVVTELRGKVQVISYAYDYMGNELCRKLLTQLRSGKPLTVAYLPDDADTLRVSEFVVQSVENPTFAFSKKGIPYWHNISFTLREVRPHA